MLGGRVVKSGGALYAVDVTELTHRLSASRDYLMGRASMVDMDEVRQIVAPFFPLETHG